MFKKLFVIFTICCFFTTTSSVYAMGYSQNPYFSQDGYNTKNTIGVLKQYFSNLIKLKKMISFNNVCHTSLTTAEIESIKDVVSAYIEEGFIVVKRPEYQSLVSALQVLALNYFNVEDNEVLNILLTFAKPNLYSDKKTPEFIKGLTIIGIPVGLILTVLSWIPYLIALFFEDIAPLVGLFFYAISVIMTGIGWYFIL